MSRSSAVLCVVGLCLGCNGSATNTVGDGEGAHSSGGAPLSSDGEGSDDGGVGAASGGAASSGGLSGGGDGTGGSSNPASGGAGGEVATGGSAGAGGSPGGTGGTPTDGGGGGGMGGSPDVVDPSLASSGCELATPGLQTLGTVGGYLQLRTSKPDGYDGVTPWPIVFILDDVSGNSNAIETVSPGDPTRSDLARDFLIVSFYRHRDVLDTWVYEDIELYDAAYEDEIERSICFDKSRIFGVGNADGGTFLARFINEESPSDAVVRPRDFRATAMVGAVYLQSNIWLPGMPTLFVHSENDSSDQLGGLDGTGTLGVFQTHLSCGGESAPAGSSVLDGATTTCTDFPDCTAPFRFCSYDQPAQYDQWESLYTTEIHRFFSQYL